MPRVTRAQAEAAVLDLDALTQRADELFSNIRGDWSDPRSDCRLGFESMARAAEKIELLRAYLAQRPDEDTVRKGHDGYDDLAWLVGSYFQRVYYTTTHEKVAAEERALEAMRAIRAAMYQPEEEA